MPKGVYPRISKIAPLDRLMRHVEFDTNGGCWLWSGATERDGYGHLGTRHNAVATHKVHRLSWRLFRGGAPAHLLVLHRCDVRVCVNPDHLFLGTHKDNMRDMRQKGRASVANAGPQKISPARVTEMCAAVIAGEATRGVARRFGVCPATVRYHLNKAPPAEEAK